MKKLYYILHFFYSFNMSIFLVIGILFFYQCAKQDDSIEKKNQELLESIHLDLTQIYRELFNDLTRGFKSYNTAINSNKLETIDLVDKKGKEISNKIKLVKLRVAEAQLNENKFLNFNKVLTSNQINEVSCVLNSFRDSSFLYRFNENERKELSSGINNLLDLVDVKTLKGQNITAILETLTKIEIINTKIEIFILQFIEKASGCSVELKFDKYGIMISPYQTVVKVGEPFKAEISFFNYLSNLGNNFYFVCDGQRLATKEGIAFYQNTFKTSGKQTITIEGFNKNPLTDEITQYRKDYIIDVLPKCT